MEKCTDNPSTSAVAADPDAPPHLNCPAQPIDGARLKDRRTALNLGQRELGAKIGVALNTIARWEGGTLGIDHPDFVDHQISELEAGRPAPKRKIGVAALIARRNALGLDPQQLADRLDVSRSTVVRWESRQITIGNPAWLLWKLGQIEAEIQNAAELAPPPTETAVECPAT